MLVNDSETQAIRIQRGVAASGGVFVGGLIQAGPGCRCCVTLLNGEIFYTLREARVVIEAWRNEFNQFRPHSSIGYRPPAPETRQPTEPVSAKLRLALLAAGTAERLT